MTSSGGFDTLDTTSRVPLKELEGVESERAADQEALSVRRFQPADRSRQLTQPVEIDGKFFAAGGERFEFRGVTYGTFAPRADGALFPERERIERDVATMRAAGFSVVRTYTVPPEDLLETASGNGLRILAGVFYPDWRYLLGSSRRANRRVAREASREVRAAARRFAGNQRILGLSLGNEVPADVLRWHGMETVANTLEELVEVVREEDPDRLVTYANYPTAEYLPLDEPRLPDVQRLPRAPRGLPPLPHQAAPSGGRPSAGARRDGYPRRVRNARGERHQAEVLDWQFETALERGVSGTCVFRGPTSGGSATHR